MRSCHARCFRWTATSTDIADWLRRNDDGIYIPPE
jgi:hypothetical protein